MLSNGVVQGIVVKRNRARSLSHASAVLAIAAVAGCADPVAPPAASATAASQAAPAAMAPNASSTPDAAQVVARALAGGMRDPAIRALVRDVMRASRVNEHKVVLQDLIATPGGERIL